MTCPPPAAPSREARREERGWDTPGACWSRQSRGTASGTAPWACATTGLSGLILHCQDILLIKTCKTCVGHSVPFPGGARPGPRELGGGHHALLLAVLHWEPLVCKPAASQRSVRQDAGSGGRRQITSGNASPTKHRLFDVENIPGLFPEPKLSWFCSSSHGTKTKKQHFS